MLTSAAILRLLHLQLELECKRASADGLIFRVPCANPDDISRVFAVRLATGDHHVFLAADARPELIATIRALPPATVYADEAAVLARLHPGGSGPAPVRGRTYHFASPPAEANAGLVRVTPEGVGIWVDGDRAAWAWSSRSNGHAAELAVETLPAYRRRGYAQLVSAAWANVQLGAGRVAFYSHLAANTASAALAQRLGVVPLFDWVSYD